MWIEPADNSYFVLIYKADVGRIRNFLDLATPGVVSNYQYQDIVEDSNASRYHTSSNGLNPWTQTDIGSTVGVPTIKYIQAHIPGRLLVT